MQKFIKKKYYDFLRGFEGFEEDSQGQKIIFTGKDIKKIRKKYNISQRCFAAMLNISVKTLQNYEVDRYSIPGTARSLFIFVDENVDLFKKHYFNKIENLEPYRDSENRKKQNFCKDTK